MPKPPPDQSIRNQALDLDHDVFLAAGAGTGKTTVLVSRYMAALKAGISPHEIVAITFTVKAAAEMRQRLREECHKQTLAADPEQARHWRRLAAELETAPIATIHSFCGALLRDFAIAAGLDPHYTVMEERPAWLLQRRIVKETLLARLAAGEESCVVVIGEYGRNRAETLLHDILGAREHYVGWLNQPPTTEQVLEYWAEIRSELIEQSLAEVLEAVELHEAVEILEHNPPVAVDAKFAEQRDSVIASVTQAQAATDVDYRITAVTNAYAAAGVPKRGGKADDWGGKERFQLVKDALNRVKKVLGGICDALAKSDDEDQVALAAANTAALWAEAAACSRAYQAAKAQQSALDFTDLQLQAARLLADNPQVRRRCRQRYQQVMVDEFQDTNQSQWQIVAAITGFDSQNADRSGPRLFLVGDAKQSIYGFRNADVTVFRRTRDSFAAGGEGVDELLLEASFRSTSNLNGFHNWLFAHEAVMGTGEKPDYAARFEPVRTQRQARDDGLAGEVLITDTDGGEDNDNGPEVATTERRREAEAANIAKRLREMLDQGFTVCDKNGESRPIKPGDIALLFRATTNINLYERALRHHDIPFYTVVGRGFWWRPEVSDILNMVRVLDNRHDGIALAGVLRSPMFGFDDNELYRVAQAGDSLFEGLSALAAGAGDPTTPTATVEKARWACAKLEQFRSLSRAVPLSVLLRRIVDGTGYSAAMAAQFAGRRMLGNIEKLIEVSRGFEREGNYTLGEFVAYVQTLSEMEDREGEAPLEKAAGEAVQLLTIHQAKGLEWPVVVIPDFGRSFHNGDKALVISTEYGICARSGQDDKGNNVQCGIGKLIGQAKWQRELAELRRVLYVAATRARDYLIVSAGLDSQDKKSYPADSWLSWLAEVSGWDLAAADCQDLGEGSWQMPVRMPPPSELPPMSAPDKSLAERHQVAFRSARTIGDATPGPQLRRQVAEVPIATAALEAITVTGLSQYRRCPLAFKLRFIEDAAGLDETWGLGRLEGRASGALVGSFAHLVVEMVGREGSAALDEAMATAGRSPEVGGRLNSRQMRNVRNWIETYLQTPTYATIIRQADYLRSEVPVVFGVDGVMVEARLTPWLRWLTAACTFWTTKPAGHPTPMDYRSISSRSGCTLRRLARRSGSCRHLRC